MLKGLIENSSLVQESILSSRLLYDLRIAAGRAGYFLQAFQPDPDIGGFDVILDDGEKFRKIQLKSVRADATTSRWKIHLRHLKPDPATADRMGLIQIHPWIGVLGGTIITEYQVQASSLDVKYHYTDSLIIYAISRGVLASKTANEPKIAENLWARLSSLSGDKYLWVPRSLFVPAVDCRHLLALMGLKSTRPYTWDMDLLTLAEIESGRKTDPKVSMHIDSFRKNVSNSIERGN
ncbi:MAG TPA: hypothetical protein VKB51_01875 [bacterium]|nr:hypothetical protein [bacterium]